MGCDIHGYIEYDNWVDEKGNIHRACFAENLGERDYTMFGLLAGVRRGDAIFAPRGIPDNLSSSVKYAFHLSVIDDGDDANGEGFVSKKQADEWVQGGISNYVDDDNTLITHPDWHTPSWLTAKEFEQVLSAREEFTTIGIDQEWYAILAAMKALKNARFVFWFDN